MYNIISNILQIPAQYSNNSVTQAAVAILILAFIVTLHALWCFFGKIFSIK